MLFDTEYVVFVAYTDPIEDTPVVDIFGGEVIYDPDDGSYEGYERGHWWESVPMATEDGVPAALDDIDTTLTRLGYERTGPWHGPKVTRRGERYVSDGTAHLESLGGPTTARR
ncbi:hypothetical protein BJY24_007895 [Nocardia transvalensis]|uniref:Uncharacterized protein n=1 Tax=Nocardia transvalensis TaxID=37333 RepID=A0A7W9UN17_9NOCA|nr:hypothetical protein [Nocardia transvalensis]MBB5918962.1 hypothetical protein [Nocardia transvalensis]